MSQNADTLLATFYENFQQRNPDGMIACYHPEVTFHDPVFQTLHGPAVGAMWRMLLQSNASLVVTFDAITLDGDRGSAHWEARYVFSQTGRPVHNIVTAHFRLRDHRIIEHRDDFNLWRWAGMALGRRGSLLGWTPLVQGAIRRQAQGRLQRFMARTPANSATV